MAIAAGDIVAMKRTEIGQPSPGAGPTFGIATDDAAAAIDVLWDNGQTSSDIPEAYLDKIDFTTPPNAVYRFSSMDSPEFIGIGIATYTRQTAGAGAATSYTLLRLVASGQFVEGLTSELVAISGR